ncbi:hypothetical protein [Pleomorphomonas carboxyditropha]|uniref:Uncharacterized protein n=1 Tax=Pleomorphomonas carboxyditropha TaxID=2023338 RepID=A0A2G9WV98_9HYPH|nr:hypothetical protein [Pleomorphomonas carboxyditropha]PIO98603.1 hypothetical protein CJ014_14900 [Pleomorphomonas carboxyditropha]
MITPPDPGSMRRALNRPVFSPVDPEMFESGADYVDRPVPEGTDLGASCLLLSAVALRLLAGTEMLRTDEEVALMERTKNTISWVGFYRSWLVAGLTSYEAMPAADIPDFRDILQAPAAISMALFLWRLGEQVPATKWFCIEIASSISILRWCADHQEQISCVRTRHIRKLEIEFSDRRRPETLGEQAWMSRAP